MVERPSVLCRLTIAAAIPHSAVVIAYRPLPDVEPTVRTITELSPPSRTEAGDWIVRGIDDAHLERACSTFRVDRMEICALYSLAGPEPVCIAL